MSAITIREYKPADKKQLIELHNAVMDHFLRLDPFGIFRRKPEYGRRYADYSLRESKKHGGKTFVAMDGKTMAGFITGAVYTKKKLELTFYKPIKTGYVYTLYVRPEYQRKKIGKKLMDTMETYFKRKGCHIVRLDAVGSHTKPYEYYKKRKYEAWGVDMIKVLKKI